jgi:hypothetical protein
MLAFQEFSTQFKGLVSLNTKLAAINYYIEMPKRSLPNDQMQQIIEDKFNAQESFKEFYDFINAFNIFYVGYMHLFNYDFTSKEFDSLLEETFKIQKNVDAFIEGSIRGYNDFDLLKVLVSEEYNDSFWRFVDKLRTEVNN